MERILRWFLRKYGDARISELEIFVKELSCDINALEAECRMYRIRLGWEFPGRYHNDGHWVWHSSNGSQKPFPGVR